MAEITGEQLVDHLKQTFVNMRPLALIIDPEEKSLTYRREVWEKDISAALMQNQVYGWVEHEPGPCRVYISPAYWKRVVDYLNNDYKHSPRLEPSTCKTFLGVPIHGAQYWLVDPPEEAPSVSSLKNYELDRLVAEKVMRWTIVQGRYGDPTIDPPQGVYFYLGGASDDPRSWAPSEDMNHALEVLAKLDELGFEWELMNDYDLDETTKGFSCKIEKNRLENWKFAETAPRAVCLAALAAIERN